MAGTQKEFTTEAQRALRAGTEILYEMLCVSAVKIRLKSGEPIDQGKASIANALMQATNATSSKTKYGFRKEEARLNIVAMIHENANLGYPL